MRNIYIDPTTQVDAIMQRLRTFLEHLNISMYNFGETTNIAAGGVSKAMNAEGRYNMGIDKFVNIFNAYPQLNPMWLLFDRGPMLTEEIPDDSPSYAELLQQNQTLEKHYTILKAKAEAYVEILQYFGQSVKSLLIDFNLVSQSIDLCSTRYSSPHACFSSCFRRYEIHKTVKC